MPRLTPELLRLKGKEVKKGVNASRESLFIESHL
jgi:hypothetical protein